MPASIGGIAGKACRCSILSDILNFSAGGDKFLIHDCVFKFASTDGFSLYGGADSAAKVCVKDVSPAAEVSLAFSSPPPLSSQAASAELRALTAILEASDHARATSPGSPPDALSEGVAHLRVPLFAVVDWRGHRVCAASLLPVRGQDSLRSLDFAAPTWLLQMRFLFEMLIVGI